MNKRFLGLALVFLVGLITVATAITATAAVPERAHNQVLVEAGWSHPYGDLGQDFSDTRLGFGAGDAMELGFRWRYHFSPTLSLSPAFHFVDYRDFKSTDAIIGDYRISASSLRYTLELMMIQGDLNRSVRPFLAFSGGLYRNRVVGFNKNLSEPFDQSVNTLGFGVRAGIRVVGFELSALYNLNRFTSWQFFQTGQDQEYNWDSFAVRAAWIIPFSDGPSR